MDFAGIDTQWWSKTLPAILANAALLFYLTWQKHPLRRYLSIFATTTLCDIAIAGELIPIADKKLQGALEYFFVFIGDLRFTLLVAHILYSRKSLAELSLLRPGLHTTSYAIAFALLPGVSLAIVSLAFPQLLKELRQGFLFYEIFFAIMAALWIFVLQRQSLPSREQRFLRRVAILVLAFYGLWALADTLILAGQSFGYVLRIVPNLLYYCAFLWWVAWLGKET
ncbi:MAG: hypothetical protein N2Z22_01945 [Turneriella sp.]|nr:hypothetical protein [Turneriella sp.]